MGVYVRNVSRKIYGSTLGDSTRRSAKNGGWQRFFVPGVVAVEHRSDAFGVEISTRISTRDLGAAPDTKTKALQLQGFLL